MASSRPPTLKHLVSASLREQAASAIRAGIITGELSPGEIYSVPYFSAQLGVSATPVREALLDLASEGLVEPVRNRGFLVPELSDLDLDNLVQIRLLLEPPSAALAVEVITESAIRRCQEHVNRMAECAHAGDLAGWLDHDRAFHVRFLDDVGNRRLVEMIRRLRDQTRLYGLLRLVKTKVLIDSANGHQAILDAASAHDGATAADLTRRHLLRTRGIWAGRDELAKPLGPERLPRDPDYPQTLEHSRT